MKNGTTELVCDWTAVHDAVDGQATAVKVYGTCTCDTSGYSLRLERTGQSSDQSPHLSLMLMIDERDETTDETKAQPTPYEVEYHEMREARVERVTIGGAADVSIEVMHPRDV